MKLPKLSLLVLMNFGLACISCATNDGGLATDIWKEGFVKRLDSGYLLSPLPDPRYPPQLEFIFLCWNGSRFYASGDYHNLTSLPIQVEGREIENKVTGSHDFYPYATLEVSNDRNGEWKTIGASPSIEQAKAVSVSMSPNSLRDSLSTGKPNRACYVEVDAFRPCIGKFLYGRAVLKDGSKSQLLVLTDLLPNNKGQ